jgi:hypothetical protein
MTTEERFERIETALQLTAETLQTLAQSHVATQAATAGLIEAQTQTQETISALNQSITRSVDAAEARTKRLEENLDALIRAITAEHSNGKSKHQ